MFFLPFLWALLVVDSHALETRDAAIDVEVTADDGTGFLQLTWTPHEDAVQYRVYRRTASDGVWVYLGAQSGDVAHYLDAESTVGTLYEYRIEREMGASASVDTVVLAGYELPPKHHSGLALVVLEEESISEDAPWVQTWLGDVETEGWDVEVVVVSNEETPEAVKAALIEAAGDAKDVAVVLIGHVPVPYSGLLAPDGHSDHHGAWPTDGYYGELDGPWTDESVDKVGASRAANHNTPGDGKFDQSHWPSDVDWMVGRVDLSRLPQFEEDPSVLYERYFEKNHAFRHGLISVPTRVLVDDNFGYFNGEAFASTAWSWSTLVGRTQIFEGDWLDDLSSDGYLLAYGCGAGSYSSANGVGQTSSFAVTSNHAVFGALFGSYFGDWDSENNLMRAALATQGSMLTVGWSGRPKWNFNGLALGEPIGASVRRSQNSVDSNGLWGRGVHIALMGDPTLKMHPSRAVDRLQGTSENGWVTVSWEGVPTDTDGVVVYGLADGRWEPLHDAVWLDAEYSLERPEGTHVFGVRSAHLERTPSGSFWKLGRYRSVSVEVESVDDGPPKGVDAGGCGCNTTRPNVAWLSAFFLVAIRARRSRIFV